MAQTNAHDQRQPLPEKVERRLAELLQMEEFDQGDLAHCRRTYWAARADWHKILIDCYEMARRRVPPPTTLLKSAPAGQVNERRAFLAQHQGKHMEAA